MRKSKAVEAQPQNTEVLTDQIARKAYELYEQRGRSHGQDFDDWLTAEQIIQEEVASASSPPKTKGKVVSLRRKKADS